MNAQYQPYASVIHGTMSGATTAPMLVPELKMPVANARSRFGNHSATTLIDAGKFPASPMPSANRAAMKPATEAEYARPASARAAATHGPNTAASACAMAARLQITIAMAKPSFAPMRSMMRPESRSPIA